MKRYGSVIVQIFFFVFLIKIEAHYVPARQSQIGALNIGIRHTHHEVLRLHEKLDAYHTTVGDSQNSEVGQPISQSDIPYMITQSGSYYLAESIMQQGDQTAIAINADNVSLDLHGYTISGVSKSMKAMAGDYKEVAGICIENVQNVQVTNGTIQKVPHAGMLVIGSSHVRCAGVISRLNQRHGFEFRNAQEISLQECVAADNSMYGFYMQSSSAAQLNNCQAQSNGMHGMMLYGSNRIHLLESIIGSNSAAGMHCTNTHDLHIARSIFEANKTDGIYCQTGQRCHIIDCLLRGNIGKGISAQASDWFHIDTCSSHNNTQAGIAINNGDYCQVSSSSVKANGGSGISHSGSYSSITDNAVAHNGIGVIDAYGIDIGLSGTTNEIFGNRSKHNGVSPGLPVATDTNYSAGVYQSPLSSPIGAQVWPGGGVGILENITTT